MKPTSTGASGKGQVSRASSVGSSEVSGNASPTISAIRSSIETPATIPNAGMRGVDPVDLSAKLSLVAFEKAAEEYQQTTDSTEKGHIYKKLNEMALKLKQAPETTPTQKRAITSQQYQLSRAEVARLRSRFQTGQAPQDPIAAKKPVIIVITEQGSQTYTPRSPSPDLQEIEQGLTPPPLPASPLPEEDLADDQIVDQPQDPPAAPDLFAPDPAPQLPPAILPAIIFPPAQPDIDLDELGAAAPLLDDEPQFVLSAAEIQKLIKNTSANSLGVKKVQLQDIKNQTYTRYYCDNILLGEQTPTDKKHQRKEGNAQKYLSLTNKSTAVLEQRRRFRFKSPEDKELVVRKNKLFAALAPELNATALNFMVDETGKVVTKNAGEDLFSYLNQDDSAPIPCRCFKDVANDLKIFHQKGIHHIDIKPENLSFHDQKIMLIDTDNMPVLPTDEQIKLNHELAILNKIQYPEFTSIYMPSNFQTELGVVYSRRTNLDALRSIRQAADNFGFFMSMMEGTENDFFVQSIDPDLVTTNNQGETIFVEGVNPETVEPFPRGTGLRTEAEYYLDGDNNPQLEEESELERAKSWADIYVKQEHKEDFIAFMKSPLSYAHGKKPELVIADIINWDALPPED